MTEPVLIQGGMGAAVSNWTLAKAVSQQGHLGVVSGTALDVVFARRLQDGDPGGHIRRALKHFPCQKITQSILDRYFIPGGKKKDEPYKSVPMHSDKSGTPVLHLTIVANFSEVFLAKEGHKGIVGINYLEKIQTPLLPSLYGAMLADVDYVLMGAGIPRAVPGILDGLCELKEVSQRLSVDGADSKDVFEITFNPRKMVPVNVDRLKRPKFIAIVSSYTLALTLAKKASGRVDGFVVELPVAGGHNAPPRGGLSLNEKGEPIYGDKDQVDLEKVKKIGLPFWLAGSYDTSEKFREARTLGAQGVQLGTAFAYCRESGLTDEIKAQVIKQVVAGEIEVFTDPKASGSGYPFKVVKLEGSLSEEDPFENRPRICDVGFLRTAYKKDNGTLGFRCPGEPVEDYIRKGGNPEDTEGRKCLCNALASNVGAPQIHKSGYVEQPLITSGNALSRIGRFLKDGELTYSAKDVVDSIVGDCQKTA